MYEPQVGDRVRRTYPDGTIMEGIIARVGNGWGYSGSGYALHNFCHPHQTELLERPVKLNTEPGAVYGYPDDNFHRVVRVGNGWLGYVGNGDDHWYGDEDIERLVRNAGWVEFNLDGSRKNEV